MSGNLTQTEFPKIDMRLDQSLSDIENSDYQNDNVIVVAPDWVEVCLEKLFKHIPKDSRFDIIDRNGGKSHITIGNGLSLRDLVMISRNESSNVSGIIRFSYYKPLITDKSVIYSLKDLVRQCVIVGVDETTHFGGYPRGYAVPQVEKVVLIDLIGLQFQIKYNSGRLVLIEKNPIKGLLDEMIYKSIVGEDKKSYSEVSEKVNEKLTDKVSEEMFGEKHSDRYIKCGNDSYFDSYAYKKFVANDVFITGLAVNQLIESNESFEKSIKLKFLKYGTGFFAGSYQSLLENHIYDGLALGLEKLFKSSRNKVIKSVELPFYKICPKIYNICKAYEIECKFTSDDALKCDKTYLTATTNCADPHAVTGNEMGYSSVDAAIAQNLKRKGNTFSPIINKSMKEMFIQIDVNPNQYCETVSGSRGSDTNLQSLSPESEPFECSHL